MKPNAMQSSHAAYARVMKLSSTCIMCGRYRSGLSIDRLTEHCEPPRMIKTFVCWGCIDMLEESPPAARGAATGGNA